MNSVIKVRPRHEREAIINAKSSTQCDTERFHHHYTGKSVDLPKIDVEIDLPIYRMSNGRTTTEQIRYVDEAHRDERFFENGEEDVEAQRVQHKILAEMAERGRDRSIIPIKDKLANDRIQTESILVTRSGVVVNGNRRLAAMRELLAEDPETYGSFAHVAVLVLEPGITEAELRVIEYKLQVAPETKLPYGWVDQLLSLKRLTNDGADFKDAIAALGGARSESDLKADLDRLRLVEMYLREYLKEPHNYRAVMQLEQHFANLSTNLQKIKKETEKEAARKIAFALARVGTPDGRLHDMRKAFNQQHLAEVTKALVARGLAAVSPELDSPNGTDELFPVDGPDEEAKHMVAVGQYITLGGEDAARSVSEAIPQIIEEIEDRRDGERIGTQALSKVRESFTKLLDADLGSADPSTYEPIENHLAGIRGELEKKCRQLDGLKAEQAQRQ